MFSIYSPKIVKLRKTCEFEGTVTHKKEVHEISYTSGRDCDDKCYSGTGYLDEEEEDEIREALDGVFGNYKWNYHE